MAYFITLGKYNTLFRYFWYHIIVRFFSEYLIQSFFPRKTNVFKDNPLPPDLLIQEGFNYLGTFICSLFLMKYEVNQTKINKPIDHKSGIQPILPETRNKNQEVILIYNDAEGSICQFSNFIIIILLFICEQSINIFLSFSLRGLDFWMPELLFICYLTYKMFRIPIYLHKKVAIIFILIFCTLFKSLSLVYRFDDDPDERIYKYYKWIIPIGIIIFVLIELLRSYTFCKIKALFDYKFVLTSKFLAAYGLFGAVLCFSSSIISTNVACISQSKFKYVKLICNVNHNGKYYYDSYSNFFNLLWRNRDIYINIIFIFIFLIEIILSFFLKLYALLILKKLNPEYYICSNSLYYFIIDLFDVFAYLITGDREFKYYKVFGTLAEFLSLLGTIVYLELIELHFCGLDHDLKKYIGERSLSESKTIEFNGDEYRKSELEELNE